MSSHCPLCGSLRTRIVFSAPSVPVHQNLLYSSQANALDCPVGDLTLCLCSSCGFCFNSTFKPDLLSYSQDYDNNQSHSRYFRSYISALADRLTDQYELSAKTIIEVGCGKGDFLRLLCAGGSNTGLGFDPSYTGPDSYPDIDVTFIREFFDPNTFGCCPDFVCSRHVIEHLEFPLDMLRIIRSAASRNPDCVVYVETPDLLWILQHGAFWDLPYEHCSYFTAETLRWALETAGFEILTVGSAFNGQYLQAEARPAAHECRSLSMGREHIDALAQALGSFSDQYPRAVARQRAYLAEYTCGTGAAIWGAAAKGVTFVNIVDPQQQLVRYLIDINPSKMAKFVPRTAHRVVDPGELLQNPVALVLTMNPNYEAEVRATLARLGVSPKMVSL